MVIIEKLTCPDCGELKEITEFPRASVAKNKPNYYRTDHLGIPRKRNRCAACQKIYNAERKAAQREREREAIAEAHARGDSVAVILLDKKAPKASIADRQGRVRRIVLE